MSRQLKRTKAQRRWRRKGYTHEIGWWARRGEKSFLLVLRPESLGYFRQHLLDDEFIRPICSQLVHKGGKP